MSDLERISPEFAELFLRIDAAEPADPVLRVAANLWQERRGGALSPAAALIEDLPAAVRPHVFIVRKGPNGRKEWIFAEAGTAAQAVLGKAAGRVLDASEPGLARRLQALFTLVAEKGEPWAASFELSAPRGQRRLCEVYAAPLVAEGGAETALMAVINRRAEAMR